MTRRPFKAVPLKQVASRPRRKRPWWRQVSPIMVMLPLSAFTAVFLWGGPPPALTLPSFAPSRTTAIDREAAHFGQCDRVRDRDHCVIDGDTIWYRGEKIRIADINAPETHDPRCDYEAQLGARATDRLQALLNAGPFTLEPIDRDRDVYGRLLRTVTRNGASVGETLVSEGLAEEWRGYRRDWC